MTKAAPLGVAKKIALAIKMHPATKEILLVSFEN